MAGLAVSATEYGWAQRLLEQADSQADKVQFGVLLLGLGLAVVFVRDVDLPFWILVTGGIAAVTAAILPVATRMAFRAAGGEDLTHDGEHVETNGPLQVTTSYGDGRT